jgi:hypothetical protein
MRNMNKIASQLADEFIANPRRLAMAHARLVLSLRLHIGRVPEHLLRTCRFMCLEMLSRSY